MSDRGTIQWVVAAAVIAALGTPAGAADLLPLLPPRHLPHRPLGPVVPPGHLPRASTGLPSGEGANSAIAGWGANSTFMGTSVAFPTDRSGVIGGTQGNQPLRREGWYGNPVGLIHGSPHSAPPGQSGGPVGTLCLKRERSIIAFGVLGGVGGAMWILPPS
jgi:hypothetical protein